MAPRKQTKKAKAPKVKKDNVAKVKKEKAVKVKQVKVDIDEFPLAKDLGLRLIPTEGSGKYSHPPNSHKLTLSSPGNCQFRAFSDQLYAHQKHHAEIRAETVKYMAANPDSFKPFVSMGQNERTSKRSSTKSARGSRLFNTEVTDADIEDTWTDYLDDMAKEGTYGDEFTASAFAQRYQMHLTVFQKSAPPTVYNEAEEGVRRQKGYVGLDVSFSPLYIYPFLQSEIY